MKNTGHIHWEAFSGVMRYLNRLLKDGLNYTNATQEENTLEGFVGTTIRWKKNQQSVVTLSTTQAGYIFLVERTGKRSYRVERYDYGVKDDLKM